MPMRKKLKQEGGFKNIENIANFESKQRAIQNR